MGFFLKPLSAFSLRPSLWLPRLFACVVPYKTTIYPSFSRLLSWLRRSIARAPPKEMDVEKFAIVVVTYLMQPEDPAKGYLTIIPRVRVGYEMEDSQRGA